MLTDLKKATELMNELEDFLNDENNNLSDCINKVIDTAQQLENLIDER